MTVKDILRAYKGKVFDGRTRIIAISDTFDALTNHRSYRKSIRSDAVIQIIEEQSGTQFDPYLVEVFTKLWSETHFRDIILHSAHGIPLVRCPEHEEIIERSEFAKPGDPAYCPACKMSFRLEQSDGQWIVVVPENE